MADRSRDEHLSLFIKALGLGLLSFVAVFLVACATPTDAIPRDPRLATLSNGCLPQAILMRDALKEKGIQAEVLCISWVDKPGHAICVYMFPPGKNMMWGWDSNGSYRVRAFWGDAYGTALAWSKGTGRNGLINDAYYLR